MFVLLDFLQGPFTQSQDVRSSLLSVCAGKAKGISETTESPSGKNLF